MSARDAILERLRGAPAAPRDRANGPPPRGPDGDRRVLARRFADALEAVEGRVLWAPDRGAVSRLLVGELRATSHPIVLCSTEGVVQGLLADVRRALDRATIVQFDPAEARTEDGRGWLRTRAAGASIGLTGADALIAETGTVVLATHPGRPRLLSLLPRQHIVVASAELLLPDMEAWIERRALLDQPASAVTFITGPSRTADIEKVLVTGVHGPQRLTVILTGAQR